MFIYTLYRLLDQIAEQYIQYFYIRQSQVDSREMIMNQAQSGDSNKAIGCCKKESFTLIQIDAGHLAAWFLKALSGRSITGAAQ